MNADQAGGLVRVEGGDGVHVMFLQRLESLVIVLLVAAQGTQGGLEANTWYVWTQSSHQDTQ